MMEKEKISHREAQKKQGEVYEKMTLSQKTPYKKAYEKDKARYDREMAQFNS